MNARWESEFFRERVETTKPGTLSGFALRLVVALTLAACGTEDAPTPFEPPDGPTWVNVANTFVAQGLPLVIGQRACGTGFVDVTLTHAEVELFDRNPTATAPDLVRGRINTSYGQCGATTSSHYGTPEGTYTARSDSIFFRWDSNNEPQLVSARWISTGGRFTGMIRYAGASFDLVFVP